MWNQCLIGTEPHCLLGCSVRPLVRQTGLNCAGLLNGLCLTASADCFVFHSSLPPLRAACGSSVLPCMKMSLVDLGKQLLEAARRGEDDEVRTLMASGAPFTTDWVRHGGTVPCSGTALTRPRELCAEWCGFLSQGGHLGWVPFPFLKENPELQKQTNPSWVERHCGLGS